MLDRIVLKDIDTSTLFQELSKDKDVYSITNYRKVNYFPGIWLEWNDPGIQTIQSTMILCEDDQEIKYVGKCFIVHTDTLKDIPVGIHLSHLKTIYKPPT